MKDLKNLYTCALIESHFQFEDRIELPCKDMDLDCLTDENGEIPFGSYAQCYAYDMEQGVCPFLPIKR